MRELSALVFVEVSYATGEPETYLFAMGLMFGASVGRASEKQIPVLFWRGWIRLRTKVCCTMRSSMTPRAKLC